MSANHPEPAILIRRLVDLALRERELLRSESWEDAVDVRGLFNENFSLLEKLVANATLTSAHRNDLVRLQRLHEENQRLVLELRDSAGSALAELTKVSKLGNYSPLGGNHKPGPRYLDHSA